MAGLDVQLVEVVSRKVASAYDPTGNELLALVVPLLVDGED